MENNSYRSCRVRKYEKSSVPRLRWTPELHDHFVQSVQKLGGKYSKSFSDPFLWSSCFIDPKQFAILGFLLSFLWTNWWHVRRHDRLFLVLCWFQKYAIYSCDLGFWKVSLLISCLYDFIFFGFWWLFILLLFDFDRSNSKENFANDGC